MNHVYRLVWNRAKRVLQVASELAGGSGGGSNDSARAPALRPLARACAVLLGTGFAFAMAPALAADIVLSGDIVQTGNVQYITTDGNIFQLDSSDSLTISGLATFSSPGSITLPGVDNDFQDSVFLQADTAYINDVNALRLFLPTITNDLLVTSHGALDLGDAIIGGSLTAYSNGGAITGGPLSITGNSTIDAGSGDITLTNTDNDFVGAVSLTGHDVSITDKNALTLDSSSISGNLSASSGNGGAITQTGALNVTGASTFNASAGTGDILLTNADNDFIGAVSLFGNNISVADKNDLDVSSLGNAGDGDVSLIAGGVLTLPGVITTTGDLTLASNGGALTTAGALSGGNVSLTGRDGLTLNDNVTTSGTLNLATTNSAITQTAGALLVNGTSTIDAGTGAITLTNAGNDFGGAVSLTGGNVQIADMNALTLGQVRATDFAATANAINLTGNITTSNGQAYGGAVTLGSDITLASTGYGSIDFASTVDGAHALTVNTGGTTIFGGNVGGITALTSLTTDAGGSTTLSGNVTTTGAQTYGDAVTLGSNVVLTTTNGNVSFASTLDNASATPRQLMVNAGSGALTFGGAVGTGANGALYGLTTTSGTFTATTLNIGSNGLSVTTTSGAIGQNGAFTVAGKSSFDAGTNAITLANAGNDFVGAVSLVGGTTQIADKNALMLGTLTTGALTANSIGALNLGTGTIGGNLSAGSNNGAISQGGTLSVAGTSTIDAGTGSITLDDAGNDFVGAVSLVGGNTRITDKNTLTLGALAIGSLAATSTGALDLGSGSIGGTLTANSNNGAIAQGGALTVTGTSTIDAGTGSITLDDAGNDFVGAASLVGGDASIADKNGLTLGTTALGGELAVNSGGAIGQIDAIVADTLTGSSVGATTLTNANNTIANLGDFNAAGFSLVNNTPLSIVGTLDSSGDIHLDSGAVTVTGAIDAGGTTTLGTTTTLLFTGSGSLTGDLVNDTGVTFDQGIDNLYTGAMSGSGALDKLGTGTLTLDGDSSAFAGTTDVQAGTLLVGGTAGNGAALGGDVSVAANATLGGHGDIGGNVTLDAGAHLAPGNSIGTLAIDGDLAAAQGSAFDFEFGSPGADFANSGDGDSVAVGGDLTLDGATLNVADAGGMGPGLYTLFSYGGTLTWSNGGLAFGSTPAGHALSIQNLTGDKRINLLDTSGMTLNFWNGNGLASATQMGGGNGSWSTTSANWTNADGSVNAAMQPQPGFAIFGGAAGTVTIDDGSGAVAATGLQFASDGYVLNGDALTLVADGGATPTIRVGDGSAAGSGMTATIDNVLAGSDGLVKSDLGTLVLTADNIFSGTLGIEGGTLSVARDANLGDAGNAVMLDGGVLQITGNTFQSTTRDVSLGGNGGGIDVADAGNVFTLSSALSGNGAFAKSGTGTLALTGNNTFTGGTTISAGTLQIGNGGASGSIVGNVTDNGTLAFDRSDALVFAGVISGSGALHQIGSGSTVLTGANTYTGGTTISAGTLQIGNGGTTGSITGDVVDNGILAFDRSDALVFANAISGTGALQQIGSGTLVLDGDSSAFAGNTDVRNGTLIVGGTAGNGAALGGDVSVATGATLGGHGEIGGDVVNAGTLAPGASIGTLTIHGDYTQTADGTLEVDVTPDGQSDLLAVDGSATLAGGTVVVAIDGDWKPRTDYTILTADGGVDGTFDSATSDLAFLDVVLDYSADSVLLSLQRNDIAFASFAGTRNQRATAAAADTLGWHSAVYNALTLIGAEEAPAAFDALSGEIHASTRTVLMDDSHYLRDAIGNRLLGASGNGGWISGWRHWTRADGDGNAATLRGDGSGFAAGIDFVVGGNGRLGAVVGAEQTDANASARASSADIDSRHFGAYASLDADGTLLQAGAMRSSHDVDARRTAAFSGFTDSLQARYDASTTQAFVDASRAFAVGRGGVSPFLNLAWVRVHSDGFDERGGDAALQVDAANSKRTYATLGMRWNAALGSGDALRLRGSLGWSHAFGGDDVPVDSQRFLGGSNTFEIAGTPIADNAFALDAGLRWQATPQLTVDADYVGRFASDLLDQGARVTLQIAF